MISEWLRLSCIFILLKNYSYLPWYTSITYSQICYFIETYSFKARWTHICMFYGWSEQRLWNYLKQYFKRESAVHWTVVLKPVAWLPICTLVAALQEFSAHCTTVAYRLLSLMSALEFWEKYSLAFKIIWIQASRTSTILWVW